MYPTKEEILAQAKKIEAGQETINEIAEWKKIYYKDNWKKTDVKHKLYALYNLVMRLNTASREPANCKIENYQYCYSPDTGTILLDCHHPSILSTLHEYAHHLYGISELAACAWSTKLFATTFPKEFKKLHWEGHMLKLAK